MTDRFPAYDVLAKRDGLSWNGRTRDVIDARLALGGEPRFLSTGQMRTLRALADRIVPQPEGRAPIDVAALVDDALAKGENVGFRDARLPHTGVAWRLGLDALDAEARGKGDRGFAELDGSAQDAILATVESGTAVGAAWNGLSPKLFFKARILSDITAAYYAHPSAWSAIGFGGPAAPRGYVRMEADRRDAWEAEERSDAG